MGRSGCCSKVGLRRGPWSSKEDSILSSFILQHGPCQWRSLPKRAGLLRCGKSCRLRWMNYLRPGIKRGNITQDEEDLIVRLHGLLGNRWSLIAGRLPGRTDNEIKNYWNTHLLKKLNNHKSISANNRKRKTNKDGGAPPPAEEGEIQSRLYMPKALRVSSSSSSSGEESVVVADRPPPPPLEVGDPAELYNHSDSVAGELDVWEKVYAECMQLL